MIVAGLARAISRRYTIPDHRPSISSTQSRHVMLLTHAQQHRLVQVGDIVSPISHRSLIVCSHRLRYLVRVGETLYFA